MASNEDVSGSRKSSVAGSMSSRSSSFINIEEDKTSMASHAEINPSLSIDSDLNAIVSNSPLPSNDGSTTNLSEVETIVDSDCEDCSLLNPSNNLRENFFDSIQNLFQKQNPKTGLFDIAFLVDQKEIFVHKLILHLRGSTKLLKYIKLNGTDEEKIRKVDMNIGDDANLITYNELYIFTKSLYFNNIGSDLTPMNVMSILSLGKQFGIQSLINDCHTYFVGSKWEDEALTLLEKAISFNDDEIISRCLSEISKKTQMYLFSPKFLEIKHATLMLLLQKSIFKIDAKTLFDKVYEWATKNSCQKASDDSKGEVYREILGKVLNLIPFEKMKPSHIYEIYEMGILTPIESLIYLRPFIIKNNSEINQPPETNDLVVKNPENELKTFERTKELASSPLHFSVFPLSSRANSNGNNKFEDGRSMTSKNRRVFYDGPPFRPHDLFSDN